MISVKANCWLNYNGDWHRCGEVFDIEETDKDALVRDELATVVDGYVSKVFPPVEDDNAPTGEGKPKRGRRKKTTE